MIIAFYIPDELAAEYRKERFHFFRTLEESEDYEW